MGSSVGVKSESISGSLLLKYVVDFYSETGRTI